MNDHANIAATDAAVLNAETWSQLKCRYTEDPPILGFLQLCADRRFHRCIQEKFQEHANLPSREAYWIHADAGGTPRMADQKLAPNYCYFDKGVRLMGWSAHGNGCGGFPNTPDAEIERLLLKTVAEKVEEYREARHFVYFANIIKTGDSEDAVIHCRACGPA
jgi:hypothetical protein